jgi:hypothetical protein
VSAQARLTQSIADLLPQPAKLAFEKAMQVSLEWEWTGEEYRKTVAGGHITYHPQTGELQIVIELDTAIEAASSVTLVASGEVTDEVTAEATGIYYDDNWLNQTKELATEQATAVADQKAAELAKERADALKRQAEEAARYSLNQRADEAAAQAKRTAEEELTEKATVTQSALTAEANERLEVVQHETLKSVFQLVAAGYSAALQAYALEHGENMEVSEEDGIIEIQFEMER